MRKISADWVFTSVSEPIFEGTVIIDDAGKILDVLHERSADSEIYKGILCAGFVNTHCHLELSYLKNKITPHRGLISFIQNLQKKRKKTPEDEQTKAAEAADLEMRKNGIKAVGDICNSSLSFPIKKKSPIYYHTFVELFGFVPEKAVEIIQTGKDLKQRISRSNPISLTPHAPYSTSLELIRSMISLQKKQDFPISIHNQESEYEDDMFLQKTGPFMEMLEFFGIDTEYWIPPGTTSLRYYLEYFPKNTPAILVHNTYTREKDIQWANTIHPNIYWCLCPKANLYIENTLPYIELFIKHNCNIALGTDSLASNDTLSILDEILTIHRCYPSIKLATLIQWGTLNGARALGIDKQFGSLEIGKKPGIILLENAHYKKDGSNFDQTLIKILA